MNHSELEVFRQPLVAILAIGNELVLTASYASKWMARMPRVILFSW
ncbi:molybdopterin biosynthesis enzyme [Rhizobium sp. BK313]|nr:hypothetical protein [Rhizobium sp. BK313]MBB3452791.1 molybdopterin biosynthesis enzyme [Rhizobium sp. BK313]